MGNYTSNFAVIIREICEEEGIECIPLSDSWAFYFKFDEKEAYIYGYQFGLNSAVAQSICSDKSTTSDVLSLHNIPNVPHICCMSPLAMDYANPKGNFKTIEDMLKKHGNIVLKDNHGTGGDLVFLASNLLEAEHAAHKIFTKGDMAVSPYLPIDEEYRIIILEHEVMLAYSKIRPHLKGNGSSTLVELYNQYLSDGGMLPLPQGNNTSLNHILEKEEIYPLHWKHNLGQGATSNVISDLSEISDITQLARKAANALDITFASVDIIKVTGNYQVLEVNSGVMMEYLSKETPALRQTAKEIYRKALLKSLH